MISRFACWMDGQGLHDIDPAILVLDVTESAPETEVRAAAPARRLSLTVTVTFLLRERSPVRRAAVMEKIAAWTAGSRLTVSYRPEQQLRCQCTSLPAAVSALKWHAPLTVAFTAFDCPYWETRQAAAAWITPAVATGEATLLSAGYAPAPAEALVINQSGQTVNTLRLDCGDTFLAFSGLGLASGERLLITHDDHHRLQLTILGEGSRSVMDKRTAQSHDELIALPRRSNRVAVTADQPVTAKFTARGRFL
ncbi:MAG: hypothetical protein IKK21_12200 [Clostridia bacterium]|nr:hypothetical protein [Clostridia bacterium]